MACNQKLRLVYRDHVHCNDGTHLTGEYTTTPYGRPGGAGSATSHQDSTTLPRARPADVSSHSSLRNCADARTEEKIYATIAMLV